MALAFDSGSPARAGGASATSQVINIPVAAAGELIVVLVTTNGWPVTGVTSSPALTWNLRVAVSVPNGFEEWYAISAAATTYAVTVNNFANNYISVDGFALSGSTTFDASMPFTSGASGNVITFSTTAANTLVFGGYRDNLSMSNSGGFILIQGNGNFAVSQYQIYSSVQSSVSFAVTGATANPIGIVDAIALGGAAPIIRRAQPSTPILPWHII